jgi:hypothetical protein
MEVATNVFALFIASQYEPQHYFAESSKWLVLLIHVHGVSGSKTLPTDQLYGDIFMVFIKHSWHMI